MSEGTQKSYPVDGTPEEKARWMKAPHAEPQEPIRIAKAKPVKAASPDFMHLAEQYPLDGTPADKARFVATGKAPVPQAVAEPEYGPLVKITGMRETHWIGE